MSERIRLAIVDKVKSSYSALDDALSGRDSKREARVAKFEAMGGVEGTKTMPLHEIETALGLDDAPYEDNCGNLYPSKNEMRRTHERHARSLDSRIAKMEEVTLFDRIQGHFVEKARQEQAK